MHRGNLSDYIIKFNPRLSEKTKIKLIVEKQTKIVLFYSFSLRIVSLKWSILNRVCVNCSK